MTDTRERRRRALTDLIRSRALASQDELVAGLSEQGFEVTQATVSRDLEQIGAVKTRRGGASVYALPDEMAISDWAARRLSTIIGEWVRTADQAGNMVVLKTPPGSAHLVGVALDQAVLDDVVGTICGDDTLFVALRSPEAAAQLIAHFRAMIERA